MWSLEALSYKYDIAHLTGKVSRLIEGIIDNDQLWWGMSQAQRGDIPLKYQ